MAAKVLMDEQFQDLRPGPIIEKIHGAFQEMHAQPASPEDNLGGWSRRAGGWGLSYDLWSMKETDEGRVLESSATANCADNASLWKGDYDWRDVKVQTRCMLLPKGKGWGGPVGLLFRLLDSQRHYAAVVDEHGDAKILKRIYSSWDVLAWAPCKVKEGEWFDVSLELKGAHIKAEIAGLELEAEDGWYTHGCIGLVGARPCRFGPMKVSALKGEAERLAKQKKATEKRLSSISISSPMFFVFSKETAAQIERTVASQISSLL